jgi:hypothetical protein
LSLVDDIAVSVLIIEERCGLYSRGIPCSIGHVCPAEKVMMTVTVSFFFGGFVKLLLVMPKVVVTFLGLIWHNLF